MKKAAGLFIKYLVMYLSCLFPRSRKIYIFGAWLGQQYADNPKYLFLEAQNHSGIRPIWITKNPEVCKRIRNMGYEAYMFGSFRGIWMQLRAKYVVVCNGISDVNHMFMGRAVFLNLWHGVPLKKIGYDDDKMKNWDSRGQKIRRAIQQFPLGKEYVAATSSFYGKVYESAFRRPKSHILITGQPRNDLFYDHKKIFDPEHPLRDAARGRKVILYTPTHRKEGRETFPLLQQFDLQRLDAWCGEHHSVFVIKLHFYHKNEKMDVSSYRNILDMTNQSADIQELLMDTDLLVTDYSSAYIDYLLLNRPVVFYNFDFEDYLLNDREMYYEYDCVTPGYKAETFDQLLEEFERLAGGEDRFVKEREEVRNLFYCKEGQQAVGEHLLRFLSTVR